jgi:hypothetical protein
MTDAKVLLWDVENTPMSVHSWSLWPKHIPTGMIIESSELLCFGAKWLGKPTKVYDQRMGYVEMLTVLRDLLTEADMVVSWNGQRFDTKKANTEFIKHGLTPPAPYKEVDLMKVAKSKMAFASNKLDWVAQELGVGRKVDTGGFDLWKGVMAGDEAAWRKMRRYQKQDVDLLEELFYKFRPWIKIPHPMAEGEDICRVCKSPNLQKRGFATSLQGKYQRFQCNSCGHWMNGTTRIPSTNLREIS